jgi:phospholipase/carboxylesterase
MGLHPLGLDQSRDALLYVPESCAGSARQALVVSLHGAGGSAEHGIDLLLSLADQRGFLLLAPSSRLRTWDVIVGGYGPDVRFIDAALALVFRRCSPAAGSIALAGFSDGASYALSLGLANGELFRSVLAYSPGFLAAPDLEGAPEIFVSHGTGDRVLPIDVCSRRIVPTLERQGRRVVYREFDGGHAMPPEIASAGIDLFMAHAAPCGA